MKWPFVTTMLNALIMHILNLSVTVYSSYDMIAPGKTTVFSGVHADVKLCVSEGA